MHVEHCLGLKNQVFGHHVTAHCNFWTNKPATNIVHSKEGRKQAERSSGA